jgi:hypothetical protein
MSQITANIAAPLVSLIVAIDGDDATHNGDWIEAVCAARDLLAPNTLEVLNQCPQEIGQHFAASQIEVTFKALKERADKLAEALEWMDSQCDAEPLQSERRMINATLAAIRAEYAPGYFDAC